MITKEELKEYYKHSLFNIGQAEKDYMQNIVLFCIYRIYANELIFKGGTALSKCYGLDRFSEDLDFTSKVHFDTNKLKSKLKAFQIEFELEEKEFQEKTTKITLRIYGPLYNGTRNSLCKIILDISYRDNLLVSPEIVKIISQREIPSFDVYVMNKEEILTEKLRAIIMRDKARDVYDLWYLLKAKTNININLVDNKFLFFKEKFDIKVFKNRLLDKQSIWDSELSGLISNVPNFKDVCNEIIEQFK
ncbi:MAG: nucleotidyl transferase AbiEii/AbiGii toxin family protein [archaeon]